jgi:hypothetical protein
MRTSGQFLIAAACVAAATVAPIPVRAQQAPAPRAGTRPAAEVLAELGRSAGVIVLTDASVQGRLTMPPGGATAETIEQQIADIVRVLPAGTTWAKLYVPAPANGRWDPAIVADFARAQARQLGTTVGRPTPAGTVEVLGQRMSAARANEHITALNLKLVYLVTNPQAQAAALASVDWRRLTPEQRELYTQQQARRLLALDPASRVEMLARMVAAQHDTPEQALVNQVMQHLSDDERRQVKETVHREVIGREGIRKKVIIDTK